MTAEVIAFELMERVESIPRIPPGCRPNPPPVLAVGDRHVDPAGVMPIQVDLVLPQHARVVEHMPL